MRLRDKCTRGANNVHRPLNIGRIAKTRAYDGVNNIAQQVRATVNGDVVQNRIACEKVTRHCLRAFSAYSPKCLRLSLRPRLWMARGMSPSSWGFRPKIAKARILQRFAFYAAFCMMK